MLARRVDGGVTLGDGFGDLSPTSKDRWRIENRGTGRPASPLAGNDDDSDAESESGGNNGGERGVFVGLIRVVGAGIVEALENLFSGPGGEFQGEAS